MEVPVLRLVSMSHARELWVFDSPFRLAVAAALSALLAGFLPACNGKKTPPAAKETPGPVPAENIASPAARNGRREWFWRDRLNRRPEALHPRPLTETDEEIRRSVRTLLEGIRGKGANAADALVDRLAALGRAAVPELATRASAPDRSVRWASVSALCRMEDLRGQEALLQALRDEWDAPAVLAAASLPRFGEPWIIPRLIKAVGPYPVDYNPHLMVRVMAAKGLVRMGTYSGIPFLIKVLKDNTPAADPEREWDPDPRLSWEKEEALALLTELAGTDFGYHVDAPLARQAEAARAFDAWWKAHRLGFWGKAPPIQDPLLASRVREIVEGLASFQARNADGARYCLFMLGPPVFPFLAEAVRSGGFYQRFHGLGIIARLAPLAGEAAPRWTGEILPALGDRSAAVRAKAAEALGRLRARTAIPAMEKALSDTDPDVRLAAVQALGRMGGPAALRLVEKLLDRAGDPQLRVEGEAALARLAPDRTEPLRRELLSPDRSVQEWAVQKLIDLYGTDFSFPAGAKPEERARAVQRIRAALAEKR